MSRRDAIRWSRNQCICIAFGGAIAFVIELANVVPTNNNSSLLMAAFVVLFGLFSAGEYHRLMQRTKD